MEEAEQARGKIQQRISSLLQRLPRLLLKPIWGIMLGAAVSLAGPGSLVFKSGCLLAIALWLIVDVWAYTLPTAKRWKMLAGWTLTNVLLIGVMGIMYLWLKGSLQEQQDDVSQHLALDVRPSQSPNPLLAMFTITNGSSVDLGEYEMECSINTARYDYARVNNIALMAVSSASGLKANGDSESAQCLGMLQLPFTPLCIDVTVRVHYVLTSQPNSKKEKPFRFWGHVEGGPGMVWDKIPVGEQGPYFCR